MEAADRPSSDSESARRSGKQTPSRERVLALAVDIVVLAVRDAVLQVLLIRRAASHHRGEWALPGGFVLNEEHIDEAANRELREETGVLLDPNVVEQFRTYGDPERDDRPDKRVVTVAYLAIQPDIPETAAGSDASEVRWTPAAKVIDGSEQLAFDHRRIVTDAVYRVADDLEHSAVGAAFLPSEFTEAQLRTVYEAIWSAQRGERFVSIDAPNFHRMMLAMRKTTFVETKKKASTSGRPARLWRLQKGSGERDYTVDLARRIPRPKSRSPRPDAH